MPIVDYRCPAGHATEKLVKIYASYEETKTAECGFEGCTETAVRDQVNRLRDLASKKKLGDHANLSSLRFNFNWPE